MKIIAIALLCLFIFSPASALAAEPVLEITGEVVYVNLEGGFYGILGDDGKKYQPTNLPRSLRKPGLVVKVTAVSRENSFSTVMWGTIMEIKTSKVLTPPLTRAERSALQVLLERMTAFNTRDLKKLQQIDTVAANVTQDQFQDWLGSYHSFALRYIDISYHDTYSIEGVCVYTRELNQTSQMACLKFTLERSKAGWKLTKSLSEPVSYSLEEVLEAAKHKYGTDNLINLWQ